MIERLDSYFAAPLKAVSLRAARSEILAANLANADTPNYKARDFNFASALRNIQDSGFAMSKTSGRHLSAKTTSALTAALQYRIPVQDSIDGNTVETDTEAAQFSNNAIGTQADLSFLNARIRGLFAAIQGQ